MEAKLSTAALFAQIARDCGYTSDEAAEIANAMLIAIDAVETNGGLVALTAERVDQIISAVKTLRDKMKGGVDYD